MLLHVRMLWLLYVSLIESITIVNACDHDDYELQTFKHAAIKLKESPGAFLFGFQVLHIFLFEILKEKYSS